MSLNHGLGLELSDIIIALIGDDAFTIVIKRFLTHGNDIIQALFFFLCELQSFHDFAIALKNFHS